MMDYENLSLAFKEIVKGTKIMKVRLKELKRTMNKNTSELFIKNEQYKELKLKVTIINSLDENNGPAKTNESENKIYAIGETVATEIESESTFLKQINDHLQERCNNNSSNHHQRTLHSDSCYL